MAIVPKIFSLTNAENGTPLKVVETLIAAVGTTSPSGKIKSNLLRSKLITTIFTNAGGMLYVKESVSCIVDEMEKSLVEPVDLVGK